MNINLLFVSSLPPSAINLIHFRDSLPEFSQLLLPWNQSNLSSFHCQWTGVSCYSGRNFHVQSVNLSGFGVFSKTPSPIYAIFPICAILISLAIISLVAFLTCLEIAANSILFSSTVTAYPDQFLLRFSNRSSFYNWTWAIINYLAQFLLR